MVVWATGAALQNGHQVLSSQAPMANHAAITEENEAQFYSKDKELARLVASMHAALRTPMQSIPENKAGWIGAGK